MIEGLTDKEFKELISNASETTLQTLVRQLAKELDRKGQLKGVLARKPKTKLEKMYHQLIEIWDP